MRSSISSILVPELTLVIVIVRDLYGRERPSAVHRAAGPIESIPELWYPVTRRESL